MTFLTMQIQIGEGLLLIETSNGKYHNTQYKILYDMVKTTLTTNCVKNQKVREANTMFKMNMY